MRSRFLVIQSFVLAGLVLGSPDLNAQAMISYGHGVAKAGAAGSALGAGAAGLFRGIGRPLDKAQQAGSRGSRRAPAGLQRHDVEWDVAQPPSGSSLRLVGGVSAIGVESGGGTPQLLRSRENVSVLGMEWSGGPDDAADREFELADGAEREGASAAAEHVQADTPDGQARVVIAARPGAARTAAPSAAAPAAVPPPLPVQSGMSLDQVRQLLGDPKFSFVNVAGRGFNDQYVFELEDGRRIVVFARDGLVSYVELAG